MIYQVILVLFVEYAIDVSKLTELSVDPTKSVIEWRGTEFHGMGEHSGTVKISEGKLVVDGPNITSGFFIIDMTSIYITDMPAHETVPRNRLTTHLKAEEFFYVEKFPTVRYTLTGARRIDNHQYAIQGNLTIRGVTLPLNFEATIPVLSSNKVRANADITFDRQQWGVSFVGNLTDMLVDDIVYLSVEIETQ